MVQDQYLVLMVDLFIFVNVIRFFRDETRLMLSRRRR